MTKKRRSRTTVTIEPEQIIVDTREQKPLFACPPAIKRKLDTGDYSVDGYECTVLVERKSIADAFGSVGSGRRRFERECGRLAITPAAFLVVEGLPEDIRAYEIALRRRFANKKVRPRLNATTVERTLRDWCNGLGIQLQWCGGRATAAHEPLECLRSGVRKIDGGEAYKHNRDICVDCGGGGHVPHRVGCKGVVMVRKEDRRP